jgi:hypothetical protein
MTDIRGTYNFHNGSNLGLVSRDVDANGGLMYSFIRDGKADPVPITGTFDSISRQIKSSNAHLPGQILFSTFYDGYVISNNGSLGGVSGLAGTWHSQRIQLQGPKKPLSQLVFPDMKEKQRRNNRFYATATIGPDGRVG